MILYIHSKNSDILAIPGIAPGSIKIMIFTRRLELQPLGPRESEQPTCSPSRGPGSKEHEYLKRQMESETEE